jgi:hypothetical protein
MALILLPNVIISSAQFADVDRDSLPVAGSWISWLGSSCLKNLKDSASILQLSGFTREGSHAFINFKLRPQACQAGIPSRRLEGESTPSRIQVSQAQQLELEVLPVRAGLGLGRSPHLPLAERPQYPPIHQWRAWLSSCRGHCCSECVYPIRVIPSLQPWPWPPKTRRCHLQGLSPRKPSESIWNPGPGLVLLWYHHDSWSVFTPSFRQLQPSRRDLPRLAGDATFKGFLHLEPGPCATMIS